MKNLLAFRFNAGGDNIFENIYIVTEEEIRKYILGGLDGLKIIYDDMIVENKALGIITYGDGSWDVFIQECDIEDFEGACFFAVKILHDSNAFYEQKVWTFRYKNMEVV